MSETNDCLYTEKLLIKFELSETQSLYCKSVKIIHSLQVLMCSAVKHCFIFEIRADLKLK